MIQSSRVRVSLIATLFALLMTGPANAAVWGDITVSVSGPYEDCFTPGDQVEGMDMLIVNNTASTIAINVRVIFYRPGIRPGFQVTSATYPLAGGANEFEELTLIPPAYFPEGEYVANALVTEVGTGTLLHMNAHPIPLYWSDADADGHLSLTCGGDDCDDTDATVFPGAVEDCVDGIDNDCDGDVDANDADCAAACWDDDGDGQDDVACGGDDCDDADPYTYDGAPEICDGVDNNCNGVVPADEVDDDFDGYMVCDNDCDDADAAVYPNAVEDCADGIDNDCDGFVDGLDGDCIGQCHDLDGDGFDDLACGGDDCDDADPDTYPGATELCDGVDNDCDGVVPFDEADEDGDGFGLCKGDCDDLEPLANPGETEDCADGIDNDCDGDVDGADLECAGCPDADADGYYDIACGGLDCDDADADINPDGVEYCGNGVDDNCDGTDPACPGVGDLVISEIMQNPDALLDEDGEWFEVTNTSGMDLDLQGLVVTDAGIDSHVIQKETIVAAGTAAVIAVSEAAADVVDYVNDAFTLGNGADELIISTIGGTVIDEVWWDGGLLYPDPTGASMSLDPNVVGDLWAGMDGLNWCEATSPFFTGDYGTPGATNDPC